MQVKVVIGTIAFMLTMIVLGFATLLEPARMERYTLAYDGRRIEQGAEIFKDNCAACHGVEGRAEVCLDPATGEQVGCAGLPLHAADLLCGDPSARMAQRDWLSTKQAYIEGTVAVGRPWAGMPTWSQEFGGPFQQNQVENVALYVLNWESPELCAEPTPVPVPWPDDVEDLLAEFPGNPENAPRLYDVTYGCASCHGDPEGPGPGIIAPHLGDIGAIGAQRVAGQTAAQYIYESILHPDAFIAPDCPTGPCTAPSAMPNNFPQRMTPQDMADVVTYLLQQTGP